MKKRAFIWIFCLLMVILFCFSGCEGKPHPPMEIGPMSLFSFSYTAGTAANANASYFIERQEEGYRAEIKPVGTPEEQAIVCSVDEAFVRELEELLRANNVGSWNGFVGKSRFEVLDGDSFQLFIIMEDGKSLKASGYMSWPENYSDIRQAIQEHFAPLLPREK